MMMIVLSALLVSHPANIIALPPPSQGYGGTLRINWKDEPKFGANPHLATKAEWGSLSLAGNCLSRLVAVDWGVVYGLPRETGGIQGDLAYAWKISDDGLSFTFSLYQNATWSDGTPLTSADVVYTLNQVLTNSKLRKHFWFKNTMAVTSVEAPDKYTVVIRTRKFNPDWLIIFAQNCNWEMFILPKHIYEGTDWATNPANEKPVCSGPFLLDHWEKGAWIRLVRNPKYYRARYPFVDALEARFILNPDTAWAALKAHEVDAINDETNPAFAEVAKANQTVPELVMHRVGSLYSYDVYMNYLNPILANKKVRQGIACAVNRNQISKLGFFGLWPPNDLFAHEGSIWANPKARLPSYDKTRAEKLLDEAGYPRKSDGWRFEVRLTQVPVTANQAISEILKEQLEAVGVKIKWETYDWATAGDKHVKKDFDLYGRYVRYGPSPDDGYGSYLHTRDEAAGRGLDNYFGFSNKAYDALVDEALTISDFIKRKALYDKAQEILAEEIAVLSIVYEQKIQLAYSEWHGMCTMRDGLGVNGNWYSFRAIWNEKYVKTTTATVTTPKPAAIPDTTPWYVVGLVLAVAIGVGFFFMRRKQKPK